MGHFHSTCTSLTYILTFPHFPSFSPLQCMTNSGSRQLIAGKYFSTYARKSLDSFEFKDTLINFFADDAEASKSLSDLSWDTWFFKPGFPPKPEFDTSLVDVCYILAARWRNNTESRGWSASKGDIDGWKANQIVVFLERIQEIDPPLNAAGAKTMGDIYGFGESQNIEIVSRYFQIGLTARYDAVYQPTADLLGKVGRIKFIRGWVFCPRNKVE